MVEVNNQQIENSEHYPFMTRSLIDLYNKGTLTNVAGILVEPEYGYMSRIKYINDSYRITFGNDLGLNPGAAAELAKDKGFTKFVLRKMGVECPAGTEFLLPWWADTVLASPRLKSSVIPRTTDQAGEFIEDKLGYPVYVKPVDGSKGANVFKVDNPQELNDAMSVFEKNKVRVITVEEQIKMPDYRIVTLDGEPISVYQRVPLSVSGDGKKTIRQLLLDLQVQFEQEGRDTRISINDERLQNFLRRNKQELSHIVSEGETLILADISNLSAGGTSIDVTDKVAARWTHLAANIANNFNLRLCGVDLACSDITDEFAEYSVIEVNAAPGLDHYASSGEAQAKIVQDLFAKVFNALPI